MTEEEFKGRAPDYASDGVAVWVNQTKEGKPYLSIKIVGHNNINAFKVEEKKGEGNSPSSSSVELNEEQKMAYAAYIKIGLPHDQAFENAIKNND